MEHARKATLFSLVTKRILYSTTILIIVSQTARKSLNCARHFGESFRLSVYACWVERVGIAQCFILLRCECIWKDATIHPTRPRRMPYKRTVSSQKWRVVRPTTISYPISASYGMVGYAPKPNHNNASKKLWNCLAVNDVLGEIISRKVLMDFLSQKVPARYLQLP